MDDLGVALGDVVAALTAAVATTDAALVRLDDAVSVVAVVSAFDSLAVLLSEAATVDDLSAFLMDTTYSARGVRSLPADLEKIIAGDLSPVAEIAEEDEQVDLLLDGLSALPPFPRFPRSRA